MKKGIQDLINHPEHYTQGIEVIDFINSWNLDYMEGNVIKYITRHPFKGGIEDLRKAQWYIDCLIRRAESGWTRTAKAAICDDPCSKVECEKCVLKPEYNTSQYPKIDIDDLWSHEHCSKPIMMGDKLLEGHCSAHTDCKPGEPANMTSSWPYNESGTIKVCHTNKCIHHE